MNTIDFVKQIPERYKDAQAVISRDFSAILERGTSMAVNRFLGTLDKDSIFGGKSKAMFQIIQRHTPLIKHVYNGNSQAVLSYAMNNLTEILPKIPVTEMLSIGLPNVLQGVINEEQLNVQNLFQSAINQLNSMKNQCTEQQFEVVQKILNSPDKWEIFQRNKNQLSTKICEILRPAIECEENLSNNVTRLEENPNSILDYVNTFKSLNVTFGSIQDQKNSIIRTIERQSNGNLIAQRVMIQFVNELTQNSNRKQTSLEVTNALKEYLDENIIKPSIENACEQEMDHQDQQLLDKFTRATAYLQEQQKKFNSS